MHASVIMVRVCKQYNNNPNDKYKIATLCTNRNCSVLYCGDTRYTGGNKKKVFCVCTARV